MPKFRKKPVIVEAHRLGDDGWPDAIWAGVMANQIVLHLDRGRPVAGFAEIRTLEGVMRAEIGDWIIKGVKGEFYPCKPDIFTATYEPVEESDELTDLGFPTDEAVELRGDELAAVLDVRPEAPGAKRCATCVWWGDGDDRRVDVHDIEVAPCHHPRSPVDEYPDGTFGCVLHEDR